MDGAECMGSQHCRVSQGHQTLQRTPRTFLDLPQELLETIIDLAYPRISGFSCITAKQWNQREAIRKREGHRNYIKLPFTPKVADFLVCKTYFVLAAKEYIGNQPFKQELWDDPRALAVSDFVTEVTTSTINVDSIVRLPSLRILTLKATESFFDFLGEDVCVWKDRLTEEQLEQAASWVPKWSTVGISDIRGLRRFTLLPWQLSVTWTESDDSVWRENVHRLETYVRTSVTQPRGELANTPYATPSRELRHLRLYTGSAVSFGTSRLSWPTRDDSSQGDWSDGDSGTEVSESEVSFESGGESHERMRDCDFPSTASDFKDLCWKDPDRVFEWVNSAKERLELREAQVTKLPPIGQDETTSGLLTAGLYQLLNRLTKVVCYLPTAW
ncbi:hypothetical protein LTR85_004086 [Meristemomyces frigidus]|nr:hypothetical protein LTR85_004086 [Meristemomyces frigidus]